MSKLASILALCSTLNSDTVAGTPTPQASFEAAIAATPKADRAILAHKLARSDAFNKKALFSAKVGGQWTLKEKKAPSELQGFENCGSVCEILDGIKAHAIDERKNKHAFFPLLSAANAPATAHAKLPVVFIMYPLQQDSVAGLKSDELDSLLRGIKPADRAQMFKALLASEAPDTVAGLEDYDDIGDIIEGVRRQQRVISRNEGKAAMAQARAGKQMAREDRHAAAREAKSQNGSYDDGLTFVAQDQQIYNRTPQRRLLPVINSSSTAGGQNSLANGVSATLTGAPTMELEIIKMRIVVEGGATNVEIQETLVASFMITSLKIGSVDLIVGTGGVEFPMGDAVDPSFWSCLVVTGGNSNLVVVVRNEGATLTFTVSAYCRVVERMN